MPQARMLRPGRSAISLRCAIAFGSSSISIASLVPFGFFGDQTLAFAAVKKLSASFASSRSRMCGMVTPSAPASRISFTRALRRLRAVLARSAGCGRSASCGSTSSRHRAVGLHGRGIVGAFEIEEDVVVQRIRRRLRRAVRRVDRRLAALRFARRVDAEGDLALRPQIEDLRIARTRRMQRRGNETRQTRCYRPRAMTSTDSRYTDSSEPQRSKTVTKRAGDPKDMQ